MFRFSIRPLPAMLWELWRVSRWEFVVKFGGMASILALIYQILADSGEAHIQAFRGITVMLIGVECVFSTTWMGDLDKQAGFTFRLGYTRPLSNWQMVLVPMSYSAAIAMGGYLASALLAQTMLGQPMPLVGPTIIVGIVVCLNTAVVWSSTYIAEKLTGLFVATLAMVGALHFRHSSRFGDEPILFSIGRPEFFDLAWYEHSVLLVLSSLAFVATVYAVGHQRSGEGFSWSAFAVRAFKTVSTQRWWVAGCQRFEAAVGPRAFRSPVGAQFWFEWRRTIPLLFVSAVGCMVVFSFITLSALVNDTWGGLHSIHLWMGAIVLAPVFYQFLAIDPAIGLQHNQGATRLSLFDATRPLRCDQLIAIKLWVVTSWSLLGLVLMALTAILHTSLAGQWSLWGQAGHGVVTQLTRIVAGDFMPLADSAAPAITIDWSTINGWWWLALFSNFAWLYLSTTAMLIALMLFVSRYRNTLTVLSLLITANLGLWAWDVSHGMPLRWLWTAYGTMIPTGVILMSLLLLSKSITAKYLSQRYCLGVLCLWAAYVVTTLMLLLKGLALAPPIPIHPNAVLYGIAILLVPLASAAAAPLALASFRHQ